MSTRWEAERGTWVLARAGRNAARRRRGEVLMVRARRGERDALGAGDSALTDVVTPTWWHRSVHREEGAANTAGWAILAVSTVFWGAVLMGPAITLANSIYGAWWALAPRVGRLRRAPLAIAALVTAGLCVAAWGPLVGGSGVTRALTGYLMVQLVVGLALAAWFVHARGWAAVRQIESRTGAETFDVVVPTKSMAAVAPTEQAVSPTPELPEITVDFDD